MDEEDEGEEQPSWVEALSQELADEGSDQDPDYEVCAVYNVPTLHAVQCWYLEKVLI